MTPKEMAERAGCAAITAWKWCAKPENKVAYVGDGTHRTYNLTDDDYKRFLQRPKPGKRAKKNPEPKPLHKAKK